MVETQIANRKEGIASYLDKANIKANVLQVVGKKNAARFISSIVSACQTNKALAECNNTSILSAALLGEALNLSPSPQLGQFYMVPYKKKDRNGNIISIDAQFQMGAKGYKQLAMRTGQYLDLDVIEVRQGEYLGRDKFNGKHKFEFIEDEEEREDFPVIGYLAYFELLNGFKKQLYWSRKKMEKHADTYSQAFELEKYHLLQEGKIPKKDLWKYSSFWYKNFDEMAEKTMIRQIVSKWGIVSIEMENAYTRDMAVLNEDGTPMYVDNENIEDAVQKEVEQNANTVEFQPEKSKPEVAEESETRSMKNLEDVELPDFMKGEA